MPDGTPALVYRLATRDRFAPLIMIAGPPGTGKTYSALRLGRGIAGDGKICLADTDNGRSKLYADEFAFHHLDLREPYRPKLFEDAAIEAQRQGAAVFIIDNFMHEHAGPGGLLEYHEEELQRLTKGDISKRDAMNMLAWAKPKADHKHMRERLYLLNMPVILCCGAERKIAMVKQTEGQHKGKTIPVDQGLQPITGSDIPYAMTASFMLTDVSKPGVPTPIKALLPALQPIIKLDRPLDEATGAAIGAWASGNGLVRRTFDGGPGEGEPRGVSARSASAASPPSGEAAKIDTPPPTSSPASDFPGDRPPPPDKPKRRAEPTAAEVEAEVEAMIAQFYASTDMRDHLRIVKETRAEDRLKWLKLKGYDKSRAQLSAAIKASWQRNGEKADGKQNTAKQSGTGT